MSETETDTAAATAAKLIERFAAKPPGVFKPSSKSQNVAEWAAYLGKLHKGSKKYVKTVAHLRALGVEVQ